MDSSQIKVSIIIPTFNRVALLEQAVESSLKQTYANCEIIVSDNASTDGTEELLVKYQNNPKVKYYRNKTNIGMIGNWQKCIYEYVSGEYFILISDDDYFIKDTYIAKAVDCINKNYTVGMVFANRINRYEDDCFDEITQANWPEKIDGVEMFMAYAKQEVGFHLVTTLFCTKLARQIGMFKIEGLLSSDVYEFLRMCLLAPVGFVKDVVAVYRKHKNNAWDNLNAEGLLENARYIDMVYTQVKATFAHPQIDVEYWRKQVFSSYLLSCIYCEIKKENGYKRLKDLWTIVKQKKPEFLYVFLFPKPLAMFLIIWIKPVYKVLHEIFRKIRKITHKKTTDLIL